MAADRNESEWVVEKRLSRLRALHAGEPEVVERPARRHLVAVPSERRRSAEPEIELLGPFERKLEEMKIRRETDLPRDAHDQVQSRRFSPEVIDRDFGPLLLSAAVGAIVGFAVTALAVEMLLFIYASLNSAAGAFYPTNLPTFLPVIGSGVGAALGFWIASGRDGPEEEPDQRFSR